MSAPVSLPERLAERTSAARRALRRRIGLVIAVVAVLAGAGYALFFSPLLALEADAVHVEAQPGTVDVAAVEAAARARAGIPLPRLDTGALAAEIETIPTVWDATVHRDWPRGLVVEVLPRVPVAAVPVEGGVELFDVEGVDLGTYPEAPAGVPVADVPLGEDTAGILESVLAVMGTLPPDLLAQVVTVAAPSADAIEFTLADGALVRWGSSEENELKLSVLQTLRANVVASVYDVSTPRTPITQ